MKTTHRRDHWLLSYFPRKIMRNRCEALKRSWSKRRSLWRKKKTARTKLKWDYTTWCRPTTSRGIGKLQRSIIKDEFIVIFFKFSHHPLCSNCILKINSGDKIEQGTPQKWINKERVIVIQSFNAIIAFYMVSPQMRRWTYEQRLDKMFDYGCRLERVSFEL